MMVFRYNLDNTMDGFYIAPAFMDKLVVHITKNFMNLPNIKVMPSKCLSSFRLLIYHRFCSRSLDSRWLDFEVCCGFSQVPLILGIWGGKGQGKSFQCELVFAKMGIRWAFLPLCFLSSWRIKSFEKVKLPPYINGVSKIKVGCLFASFLIQNELLLITMH